MCYLNLFYNNLPKRKEEIHEKPNQNIPSESKDLNPIFLK